MQYDVVLFDLDYTLFDSALSETEALETTFKKHTIDLNPELLHMYRLINTKLWADLEMNLISLEDLRVARFQILLDNLGIKIDALSLADTYTHNLGICGGLLPGASDLLNSLVGNVKLALVTNGVAITQRSRIRKFDIGKFFDAIVISGEFGTPKPNPEIFSEALRLLDHTDKKSVLMVGDSLSSDVAGATNFHIDSCWFNPVGKQLDDRRPPTHTCDSFNDLLRIIL
ncbi:MAG: YjjG family noncanonical pyrimidine nucleotidase [Actinomycetota bacterium]